MIPIIGWAIVHSVWQAGVIAALTALLLFALRSASAATRYWVAVAGLAFMAVAPVATVYATRAAPARTLTQNSAPPRVQPPASQTVKDGATLNVTGRLEKNAAGSSDAARQPLRVTIEHLFPWIVGCWLLGVLLFSARTVAGYVWARRLARTGTKAVSDQLRGVSARIADHMGVRVAVRVLESSRVTVPMVVGWVRPVILLPASVLTGLMPQQLEALLAHELAHVRRHDYAINLLQTIVETLYFYHPAAWWLSGRIREERENACDELAVAACGGDRVFYSRVLLTVEDARRETPVLAVAASGGSLSRRIGRLLGAEQAHLDIGPRWYAGVFTIAMAVVTAGGLVDDAFPDNEATWATSREVRAAAPDTVIRYTGSGSLSERWRWAEQQAKRNGYKHYWVGYLIKGDAAGQTWYHFDRLLPVSMPGATMRGNVRMGGDFSGVRMGGTPLNKLLGDYDPYDIAVFLAYDGDRPVRLHLGSFAFPMSFSGAPVLWLDRVPDAESIERLVQIDASTRDLDLREDLTAAIGAHNDARAAVPVLASWARDQNRPSDVRREAVESVARYQQPELLGIIARIARNDPDEDVRAEAVEALGELKSPGVLDTLMVFARTLPGRTQNEALEAIGELPGGAAALRTLIDDRTLSVDMRRRALESFAETSDSPQMLETLAQLATRSDAHDIQRRAIEAMTEVKTDPAQRLQALVDVVDHHPDTDIQARAAEAIGELPASDAVLSALTRIIGEHGKEDVRRRAMEGLTNLNDDERAGRILMTIARTHPDAETRRRAVEFMSEFKQYPMFKDVAELALADQPVDVRRMAVETYISEAAPNDALAFARRVNASDAPFDVKRKVIEALGSMDDAAGIPALVDIARTTQDPELRKRAIEALLDSEDPRAVAALRKIQ